MLHLSKVFMALVWLFVTAAERLLGDCNENFGRAWPSQAASPIFSDQFQISMCLQMVLEAVRPSSHAALGAQEYTLAVALLPLRVRLDQHCVTFLQQLLAGEETTVEPSRSGSRQDLQREGSVGGVEQQGEAAAVATAGDDSGGRSSCPGGMGPVQRQRAAFGPEMRPLRQFA